MYIINRLVYKMETQTVLWCRTEFLHINYTKRAKLFWLFLCLQAK